MHKKSKWNLLYISAAVLLALLYVGNQLYAIISQRLTTQVVTYNTVYETVDVQCIVLRDEVALHMDRAGTIVPVIENSERVGKGDTVALVFAKEEQAQNYIELQTLKQNLHRLQQYQSGVVASLDVKKLDKEINGIFASLLDIAQSGNLSGFSELSETLLDKLTVRQASVSGGIDNAEQIKALSTQVAALEKNSKTSDKITAPQSGYFVAGMDGYESLAKASAISNITVQQIQELLQAQPNVANSANGKLICGYTWYIATVVDSSVAAQFKQGQTAKLQLQDYEEDALAVQVERIGAMQDGKVPTVFACKLMNEHLALMRKVSAQLVLKQYEGIQVSSEAVRVQEGETGAFVRRGNIINFRRLDILYTTDKYVIAAPHAESESETEHVEQYDAVVTKGRNLYDKKIVG